MSCAAIEDCKLPGELVRMSMDMSARLDGTTLSSGAVEVTVRGPDTSPELTIGTAIVNVNSIEFDCSGGASRNIYALDVLGTRSDGKIVGQRIDLSIA